MTRIVYSRQYNMGLFGLERLHPFYARKYGRAWRVIRRRMGRAALRQLVTPERPSSRSELLTVHEVEYLRRLEQPLYVAQALELPIVGRLPSWLIDRAVLQPMRWATRGTVIATGEALVHGLVVNLGGGFHHAKPAGGEGFCIYNDIALAIHTARANGALSEVARVAYVDLDAHQGNGVCHTFMNDRRVFIFDMYNATIYPAYDASARGRIDCNVPLPAATSDREYLQELEGRLPGFLDSIGSREVVGLAVYNAGTDMFAGDPLGGLSISAEGILWRDLFVVQQLRRRGIPTVMLLSGGYTRTSFQLIAESVIRILKTDGASPS